MHFIGSYKKEMPCKRVGTNRRKYGIMAEQTAFTFKINQHITSHTGIMRVIKSRRMREAGHVARMGDKRRSYRILVGKSD
jgi:hypothetical protein